jgi:nitrate reductase gamma subunit
VEKNMQNTITYQEAKRHVERRIGFFIHLTVYALVNSGLIIGNLLHYKGTFWALAPLFGWGIGLLFHGFAVFLHAPGAAWKQRMIEKELNKNNHQPPSA